jgi:translation initiation factor 6
MAHVETMNIKGETNIGLMIYVNNKFALIPKICDEETTKKIEEILKVPCYKISIAGTPLIGVFLNGTKDKILVPEIIYDKELENLLKIGKKHNIEIIKFKTELTCLGNNILISKNKAILNPDYNPEEQKFVAEKLNIEVKTGKIANIEIVGATIVINENKNKALIHREASKKDISLVEKTFDVEVETGSVNMGSPYIKSGIICNKNGFLVGSDSGGPEIVNADQALGFIE